MQIDLDKAIESCAAVVDRFAQTFEDAEGVCLETRSLALAALVAAKSYYGIWTEDRSSRVDNIFRKAIQAFERLPKEHARESEIAERLRDRYEDLKSVFIHSPYAGVESGSPPGP